MDAPVIAALIAAVATPAAGALTYGLTKRREREAEWRRFKLDYYREYVAAMSGVAEATATPEARQRFTDAANNLALVAPAKVLRAAYALVDDVNDAHRTPESYEAALARFFRAIRADSHASVPDDAGLAFKLFSVPAAVRASADALARRNSPHLPPPMAIVRRIEHQPLQVEPPHKEVAATYAIVCGEGGERCLQIDTYGSADREMPGKKSQSIRLTPEAVAQLCDLIDARFPSRDGRSGRVSAPEQPG